MSKTLEIEQLLKEKSGLEHESRCLDEEQKKLNLRVKLLCEKLIQEIKKKNAEKQQTVSQLQTRIGNLEAQLNKLSANGAIQEEVLVEKADTKNDEQANEIPPEEILEVDENVTVAAIEEEIELTSGQDRKKRKFF